MHRYKSVRLIHKDEMFFSEQRHIQYPTIGNFGVIASSVTDEISDFFKFCCIFLPNLIIRL